MLRLNSCSDAHLLCSSVQTVPHKCVWEEVAEGTVWASEEGSDRIMEKIGLRVSVFIIVMMLLEWSN